MNRMTKLLGTAALALATTSAFAADPDLLVFDWSGFEEEGFFVKYAEKHGSGPTYAFFGEEEEAFQKLRSGFKADVAHPCSQSIEKWAQAELIEPWDISKIPSYATLAETYRTDPTFVRDGEVYFIPTDLGMTGIAYNADEIKPEQVASLEIFLDPEMSGRTSLPDNVEDSYALAYLATGTSDWTKATEEDFKKASDWLRKAHANARAYWADGAELAQLMATGEVLIAWSWNETPVQMVGDGYNIGFEREAKEGSSAWFCGYVNLKDGPGSEEKAHEFIESFLSQETADYIVNEWGYGHSNTTAMGTFDEETLTEVGLNQITAPQLEQLPMDISLREMMIKEFERIKAGF
ncbi:spermidine/putrescine transport system substrate-binding protein [Litoreibacter ascidiaceicola]|uniref:Spermidine/putrescine transport system substrate-binding protein n=1 Tax=Litoreibacter ascidiaceicola TaxID=1486859 RepID=A0A1M4SMQ7_9RHOB|nr:extracellular solute-binding protein [Litoreibacter ascidiaceicola]SHE33510.1 spermidine/putrescine transport system substrate-binding protein [Litoreibacter ascidiaceicola]